MPDELQGQFGEFSAQRDKNMLGHILQLAVMNITNLYNGRRVSRLRDTNWGGL